MAFNIPWLSLFGGILLGISSILLLMVNGKIAGVSGILAGLANPKRHDFLWRILFVTGMALGGWMAIRTSEMPIPTNYSTSSQAIIIAGLLVGVGTRMANGCTSGHGICGIGRLSIRSIAATSTFMVTAGIVVFIQTHLV